MRLKEHSSSQKLRGAYYTPLSLANAMTNLIAHEGIQSVLEPSCGDGVFLDSMMQLGLLERIDSVDAVEIETSETEKLMQLYKEYEGVHILNEDFFEFYARVVNNNQFDLIIGNPPYIRYQYLTEAQREMLSEILSNNGMKANKLINAWVAFIVACTQMLSKKGKLAFVLPAEILQVAYAEELREFLSNRFAKITLITFEQLVFPDIEQEIVVLIAEKGVNDEGIRIISMNDLADFSKTYIDQYDFQEIRHVKEKWTAYFTTVQEIHLIKEIQSDPRFVKFADLGVINVGITTGNNKYFSITEELCQQYQLYDVTRPLIGRSSHAHGIFFTRYDWEKNKASGKRARLICFPDHIPVANYPQKHQDYIELGEVHGENHGYKCRIRDFWYIVPSVWIPDAFFLRRNNLYPKFVLNLCDAVSTDTMHRIKFHPGVIPENALLSYYNSISFAFTELCGRSYGGGVLEILPKEMGNILLPRIEQIDSNLRSKLLNYIDLVLRNGEDIESALDTVDQELLINTLNIPPEWCTQCRTIWKKLQQRRLNRR
ncbi:class I SAM-dependent methyltransferase [Selenomonas sp. oral taxon 138]|uniref:Eco57I restriction-modification methylase domain-containing protein n=1 Tax=Selenomonas sp. oral taxon 138 TaxID=712532 RepID=UPI000560D463|nr:class I SAM-dependent methyltransferase [Selenomonas sp. oral taxon 138]